MAIINVKVGSMGQRTEVLANTSVDTPKTVFERAGIDYTSGQPSLDGVTLRAGEMGQTFDDLHVDGDCYLTSIVKADGAAIVTVKVGSMGQRTEVLSNTETDTPKAIFERAGIDYTSGQPSLDGVTLRAGEMGQTLDELHVDSDCYLTSIVKADGAC